jgi:hypothetical protein
MNETLGQKRDRFTLEFARWVIEVNEIPGYKLRLCEVLRSDEQAEIHAMGTEGRQGLVAFLMGRYPELARRIANNTGSGIRTSLHIDGLAADSQLFVNGEWVTASDDPRWLKIGELWEKRGPDYAWGGRFKDAGHVSISHGGRK